MRHSRSDRFDEKLPRSGALPTSGRWSDYASDPNDPAALAHRAAVLRAAWRPPVPDRLTFLEERCRGLRVLDIGCVAHDLARLDSPSWLHGRIAAAAEECVGVDILEEEVAELNRLGFRVIAHDLGTGLGPVESMAPFDVIVAGELIEHVHAIDLLFEVGREVLTPQGELIITTPNPYAPKRVWAGQRGVVWENADHVTYAFPSGVAELAERHGLVLSEALTIDNPRRERAPLELARQIRRRIRGTQWADAGYATLGGSRSLRVRPGAPRARISAKRRPDAWFIGETFVYAVRRRD